MSKTGGPGASCMVVCMSLGDSQILSRAYDLRRVWTRIGSEIWRAVETIGFSAHLVASGELHGVHPAIS